MSPERRAQIIAQSLENLHRYKSSLAANGVSFDGLEARSADSFPSAGRASSSPPDPVEKWKREGIELERQRSEGRAQLRAEEKHHIAGQQDAGQEFWSEIDRRVAAAAQGEREFVLQMLSDALVAINELADAHGKEFDQLDVKLKELGVLLERVRVGNEQFARDKAEGLDLPNPLPPRTVVN